MGGDYVKKVKILFFFIQNTSRIVIIFYLVLDNVFAFCVCLCILFKYSANEGKKKWKINVASSLIINKI